MLRRTASFTALLALSLSPATARHGCAYPSASACAIGGCTDPSLHAFDSTATFDDGSCPPERPGCSDPTASNYRSSATAHAPCEYAGCLHPRAVNYDSRATLPARCELRARGCADPSAANYHAGALADPAACVWDAPRPRRGCTRRRALNFDAASTADDGSCLLLGCTEPASPRFDAEATLDDGCGRAAARRALAPLCCAVASAQNYDPSCADLSVAALRSCVFGTRGCTRSAALNYDPCATADDGSCAYVAGCTNPAALNYDSRAELHAPCVYARRGCTHTAADNYDVHANTDDGSCWCVRRRRQGRDGGRAARGCTDVEWGMSASRGVEVVGASGAMEKWRQLVLLVTIGGVRRYAIYGCTDPTALNYASVATVTDGCTARFPGCMDTGALNYAHDANTEYRADGSRIDCFYASHGNVARSPRVGRSVLVYWVASDVVIPCCLGALVWSCWFLSVGAGWQGLWDVGG
ncbi:hypothetical protein AB1Y20_023339 [Prymnesium parvum]|uniref:Uncharacterized protein n=1 Tax=Prymnesium parvum TaxID=97485 RepID=A0AB34JGN6_PRYPA